MKIRDLFKMSAVALAAVGMSGTALADTAETKGGMKIKTDDGRFEMSIGGRLQYDYYFVDRDDEALFGSGNAVAGATQSSQNAGFFRRMRLSFGGKLYGWEYLFVPDFSQNTGAAAGGTGAGGGAAGVTFQEMFISTKVWDGTVFLGQFKPFRGLEELTSSNEITFLERPYTTASGIYANQFVQGLGYQKVFMNMFNVAANAYIPRRDSAAATAINSGYGIGGRVVFAPFTAEGAALHTAVSFGWEHGENNVALTTGNPRYAGRRGYAAGTFPQPGALGLGVNNEVFNSAAELAGVFGPVYFQGEFATASFRPNGGLGQAGPEALNVYAYHAAASWFVTGETKPYDLKKGVFKSPKPINKWGAIELTTRYEKMENDDARSTVGGDLQDIDNFIVGANYYLNPNVRFMLNYNKGSAVLVNDTKDKPSSLGIRAHLYF